MSTHAMTYCPGCGAPHVVVGLNSVLYEIRPTFRKHVCNVGRVTIIDEEES